MKDMPSGERRGGMGAMWICCIGLLLVLLATLFWR